MAQFSSLSDLVKNYESGGNYTAKNPGSSASGAYQFTDSTWRQYAGSIANTYPTAASAPPSVQDAVFTTAVNKNGLGDWTCPGCNSSISDYVGKNDVSMLPISSDPAFGSATLVTGGVLASGNNPQGGYGSNGVGGSTTIGPGSGTPDDPFTFNTDVTPTPNKTAPSASSIAGDAAVGFAPGIYGGPQETGLAPGTAAVVSGIGTNIAGSITGVGKTLGNFFTGWIGSLENWVGRGFLILIGLVILAIALWRIVDPDGSRTQAIARNVEVAA
jgi:hypothetical protein